jgi:hypothetical protein
LFILLNSENFINLCNEYEDKKEETMERVFNILCHIFNTLPANNNKLSPIPLKIKNDLIEYNKKSTLIFKNFLKIFTKSEKIFDNDDYYSLPYSGINLEKNKKTKEMKCKNDENNLFNNLIKNKFEVEIRSPFYALSGLNDDFKNIFDLFKTIRNDVFFDENIIPLYKPNQSINKYCYDFFIENKKLMDIMLDNKIKKPELMEFLLDWELTLKSIKVILEEYYELKILISLFSDISNKFSSLMIKLKYDE